MNSDNNRSPVVPAKLNNISRTPNADNRLAIILAGGSGLPLRGLFPGNLRRQRPSQFCRTALSEIILNTTRKQIEKSFSRRGTMFVVTEQHARYYKEVLPDVPPENLIVQPQDNGTTVAVLYAALRLAATNPSAILAFFPADFHAPDSIEFMRRVESACAFARRDPNLILLGIKPDDAKTKDEWIELDASAPVDKNFGVWRVRRFLTNAAPVQTQQLLNDGALLNSSVLVGTAATFLRKISRAAPEIFERFSLAAKRFGTAGENAAVRAAYYSQYSYTDFSRDVLEKSAEKLMVVPVPPSLKSAVRIDQQAVAPLPERIVSSAQKFYAAPGRG